MENIDNKEFRICSGCWGVMESGYIYEAEVYCCEDCLPVSKEQFDKEYTDDWDNCYTEWESEYLDLD